MSAYTDFLAKPNSKKITLVEIDIGQLQNQWLNKEPGIWGIKLTTNKTGVTFNFGYGSFGFGSFGYSGIGDLGRNPVIYQVNSMTVDGIAYTSVGSLASLRSTNESFYYDQSTTIIYVHFDQFKQWWEFSTIQLGVTSGFATHAGYYNDLYYDAVVKSVPSLTQEKDFLFFGILNYSGGVVELANENGQFDSWGSINNFIFGQEVRVKFGGDTLAYSDYETIYTGYVSRFQLDYNSIRLDLRDRRKFLNRKIGPRVFDTGTYTDINDDDKNKTIPYIYGSCRRVPAVCINQDATSGPYQFAIADITYHSIKALNQVYLDGSTVTSTGGLVNDTTGNDIAYFELTSTQYTTKGAEVLADIDGFDDSTGRTSTGALIEDALDIIKDIIVNDVSLPYTTNNFNTTQWTAESSRDLDIGIVLDGQLITESIEAISNSNYGMFIIQPDNRFSYKIYDPSDTALKTIKKDELLDGISVEYPDDEYLTAYTVKYDQGFEDDGKFRRYYEDANESDIFTKYGNYRNKTFETYLTSTADVLTYSSRITEDTKEIAAYFDFQTKTQNLDLDVIDIVNAEMDRINKDWYGSVKMQIVRITKNINNNTVTITGRQVNT